MSWYMDYRTVTKSWEYQSTPEGLIMEKEVNSTGSSRDSQGAGNSMSKTRGNQVVVSGFYRTWGWG